MDQWSSCITMYVFLRHTTRRACVGQKLSTVLDQMSGNEASPYRSDASLLGLSWQLSHIDKLATLWQRSVNARCCLSDSGAPRLQDPDLTQACSHRGVGCDSFSHLYSCALKVAVSFVIDASDNALLPLDPWGRGFWPRQTTAQVR